MLTEGHPCEGFDCLVVVTIRVTAAVPARCLLSEMHQSEVIVSFARPARIGLGTPNMTQQRHFKRMLINVQDGIHHLHIGEMEIWDGADLALLREGLFKLIEHERCRFRHLIAGSRGAKALAHRKIIGVCKEVGIDPATHTLFDYLEADDRLSFAAQNRTQ